jgi:hypothetical protein
VTDRLTEIEARLKAATPGPWVAGRPDMGTLVDGVESKWIYDQREQYVAVASGRIDGEWEEVMANAHLIANAPSDIAWLIEQVRRLEQELVELSAGESL